MDNKETPVPLPPNRPAFMRTFNTTGYVEYKFEMESLAPVIAEIKEIQANYDKANKHNEYLAGYIEKEYTLVKSKDYIADLVRPIVEAYVSNNNFINQAENKTSIDSDLSMNDIEMDACWVNIQKKHEFNPAHIHYGILSFVIFIQIPYTKQEELGFNLNIPRERNTAGDFAFLYTDTTGAIKSQHIPVDKNFEGVLFLFPAKLNHTVYPFYSSDKERITVSGNWYTNIKGGKDGSKE